jgi:hypothetical protein
LYDSSAVAAEALQERGQGVVVGDVGDDPDEYAGEFVPLAAAEGIGGCDGCRPYRAEFFVNFRVQHLGIDVLTFRLYRCRR